ncbi:replication protein a 70 kda dna-binding subunit b [Nicotiana attenuata]|uniref:Replication protein a 70 kDa dna-binding subunit b n=1 Tax=Nicotiana attenuata TaxID=49451 RepID=A0A314KJM3_NICAT|nr:replication protein a 70 kda dna-binding subunit b [Nicotiana attenuata]
MATEVELSKQCLPISKVPKYSSDWVIKVFVVRRSKVIPYKNQRNEGVFKTLILVDEEGTKIQATLFNKHVEKRKDFFELSRSYFIINGRLDRVNPNYSSVHKEVEIAFTDNTIIKESKTNISTQEFSNDVVVILVTVKSLIEEGRSRRREIIVTNERYDLTSITLWGDFAENDGELLEKMKYDKPILGFCDVRVSIYKGNFGISTIPVSSVLINPTIQKATELRNWYL